MFEAAPSTCFCMGRTSVAVHDLHFIFYASLSVRSRRFAAKAQSSDFCEFKSKTASSGANLASTTGDQPPSFAYLVQLAVRPRKVAPAAAPSIPPLHFHLQTPPLRTTTTPPRAKMLTRTRRHHVGLRSGLVPHVVSLPLLRS